MFEFEPDAYIFTKFANYFKRRKKAKESAIAHSVKLIDIKPRLTIFARAVTGKAIEIFDAEREGGYKNNNFFLPTKYAEFNTVEENISFYLFRVLYLSVQKNLNLNWEDSLEHETNESREMAQEKSNEVLKSLFQQFPATQEYYNRFIGHYKNKSSKNEATDFSFIYGKWMYNSPEESSSKPL